MQTVLITGGSGKFGRKFVEKILKSKNRVIFTASSEASISSVLNDYQQYEACLHGIPVDFESEGFATELCLKIESLGLLVNGLVNNARSLKHLKMKDDGSVSRENFLNEYLFDVVAPYELSVEVTKRFSGDLRSIVNISSMYGVVAATPSLYENYETQSPLHYGVAKAALNHLTKELAVRLAPKGVRVNGVAYGGVEGRVDEGFKARYASLNPMAKMLQEKDVSGPVEFLLSEASGSMTGHTIVADGGWSIW